MSNPTRHPNGLSTVPALYLYGNYPVPAPFHSGSLPTLGVAQYSNDFVDRVGEYTATGTSSTFALTNALGGQAVLTPGGATTASSAYKTYTMFQFIAGQQAWYNAKFQVSAVAGSVSFRVGLQAGSSANDGIWFSKAASSTSINVVSVVNSTTTTLATGVATAVAATWFDVGFYYNGTDVLVYVSDNLVARVTAPTIGSSGTTLTNALLSPVFQITPTATDTMTIDFVAASVEVLR